MWKKRKKSKRKLRSHPRQPLRKRPDREQIETPATHILKFIYSREKPVTLDEIYSSINSGKINKKLFNRILSSLVTKKEISQVGKKRFSTGNNDTIFTGRVEKNPRGFGFVTDLNPHPRRGPFAKDPFLSIKRMGTANHGDKVLIRINKLRKDGRPEAEVIAIMERFSDLLTGFYKNTTPPMVIPEDPRYPDEIRIVQSSWKEIEENCVVLVKIIADASGAGQVKGEIIELLGPADNIDVQMRMVIENLGLPHIFPEESVAEAEKLTIVNEEVESRLNLRDVCHVTIDGETAKDFDDAIAVEKTPGGYKLYVSIADVSHYVRADSALDKEAYLRGTSVYFPGRVIPMLPEKLSNDLCSLVPHQDRLTFSAILDFDKAGKLIKKKFAKTVICSRQRFTYTTVEKIVMSRDQQMREKFRDFVEPLDRARELAELLHRVRMERGSIGFNIPEPEISLDEEGRINSIKRKSRNFAHQIIEEFMLAANEAVAALFSSKDLPFIYRVHEKPEEEKVEEFKTFAQTMGLELPRQETAPPWFAKTLEMVKGRPAEYVVNNLLLRTMQQARYDSNNLGHFGLAATDYTHFTSPIRRYPDLIVHRLLSAKLKKGSLPESADHERLSEQATHLSKRERVAINGEREMADRLKVFYMEQFIGEDFQAVISGVNEGVIFVELIDLFVSGSIDISLLNDDYYLYDIKRHRFIGEISGKAYQLGDEIKVTLLGVDRRRWRIYFAPSEK